MGERALAACWCGDSEYEVYYSQWAGSEAVLNQLLDVDEPQYATLVELNWRYRETCSAGSFVSSLDYLTTEAVYLLSPAGLTVYRPVWLGLGLPEESVDPTTGVLIRVETVAEWRQLREAVRFLKSVFRDAVRAGLLPAPCACWLLLVALRDYRSREQPCLGE